MKDDLAQAAVESSDTIAPFQDPAVESPAPEITVTTRDGKAILTGTVRSWEERRAAQHAAWGLPDVREVDDRLIVISDREP